MREAAFVFGIIVLLLVVVGVGVLPPEDILLNGRVLMLGAGSVGVPLEVVYFAALGFTLRHRDGLPAGWYWRSFDHHHLLRGAERWLVLPFFYVGALCFVVGVFGIFITGAGLFSMFVQL